MLWLTVGMEPLNLGRTVGIRELSWHPLLGVGCAVRLIVCGAVVRWVVASGVRCARMRDDRCCGGAELARLFQLARVAVVVLWCLR
jgi:hypothetical protein